MTELAHDGGPILRRHRRSRSIPRTRIVCFPHAGGLQTCYSSWEADLPEDVELYTACYSGRGESIADIGAAVADEIAHLPTRRTAVFGHSLGALVAYETALAAQSKGQRTPLFVSGASSPDTCGRDTAISAVDGPGLIESLRRLGGTPDEVLDDPRLQATWLPAVTADLRMLERYRHVERPLLECPITAMVGRDDPEAPVDEVRRWRARTCAGFDLVTYPGGHFYLSAQRKRLLDDLLRRVGSRAASADRFAFP